MKNIDSIDLQKEYTSLDELFTAWKNEQKQESDNSCKKTFPKGISVDDKFKCSFCRDGKFDDKALEIEILFICREPNTGGKPSETHPFWLKEVVDIKTADSHGYYGENPDAKAKKAQTAYFSCISAIACRTAKTDDISVLKKCAYMNINKRGGKSSCSKARLRNYFCRYKRYILKEIELINPKCIVLLGKMDGGKVIENAIREFCNGKIDVKVYPFHPSVYRKDEIENF